MYEVAENINTQVKNKYLVTVLTVTMEMFFLPLQKILQEEIVKHN